LTVREPKFCSETGAFFVLVLCSGTDLFEIRVVRQPRFHCIAIGWWASLVLMFVFDPGYDFRLAVLTVLIVSLSPSRPVTSTVAPI
jgi:hypothetical protein